MFELTEKNSSSERTLFQFEIFELIKHLVKYSIKTFDSIKIEIFDFNKKKRNENVFDLNVLP